jgi:ATPase subunit of ABC transporter with duplicated ATPase domains
MSDDKSNFSMSKLSKTYQEQINLFLKHLFKFLYGAKIGILGLNGSGKSSLLKLSQVLIKLSG